MVTLELDETEARVLRELLESRLQEMTGEISNTEKYELREKLKSDREVIRRVAGRL